MRGGKPPNFRRSLSTKRRFYPNNGVFRLKDSGFHADNDDFPARNDNFPTHNRNFDVKIFIR